MAAASESDLTLTTTWSRTNFRDSFKRKGRRNKGSDAGSVASSGGGGGAGDRSPGGGESPYVRHSSTDSGRKLSIRLGGRKRSKIGLGRTESESGSDVVSSRTPAAEDPPAGGEEDSNDYYTEEEEET